MKTGHALVTIVVALGALAVSAPPSIAADDPTGPLTTVTFRVAGCEGCTISSWLLAGSSDGGPSAKAKVMNGVASLQIPTAQTTGASFQIDPVKDPYMNAITLIVFQYKGAKPGSVITKAQATTYRRGSACWAGTTGDTAQIRVRVREVWGPAFDPLTKNPPTRALQPLAWVVPTQQSAPPYWPLFKGALQAQDTPPCRF